MSISRALARVEIDGPHYVALTAAMAALDKLAADLGHLGRFMTRAH